MIANRKIFYKKPEEFNEIKEKVKDMDGVFVDEASILFDMSKFNDKGLHELGVLNYQEREILWVIDNSLDCQVSVTEIRNVDYGVGVIPVKNSKERLLSQFKPGEVAKISGIYDEEGKAIIVCKIISQPDTSSTFIEILEIKNKGESSNPDFTVGKKMLLPGNLIAEKTE